MFYNNIPGVNITINEVGLMQLKTEEEQVTTDFVQPRDMIVVGTAIDGQNPIGSFSRFGVNPDNRALDYLNAKLMYGNAYEEYMIKSISYDGTNMTTNDRKEVVLSSNLLKSIKMLSDQGIQEVYSMRLRTEQPKVMKTVKEMQSGLQEVAEPTSHIQDIKDGFGNYNRKFFDYMFSVKLNASNEFIFRAVSITEFENSKGSPTDPFDNNGQRSIDNIDPLFMLKLKTDIDLSVATNVRAETLSGKEISEDVGGTTGRTASLLIRTNVFSDGSLENSLTPILIIYDGVDIVAEYGIKRLSIDYGEWIDDVIGSLVDLSASEYNVTDSNVISPDIASLSNGYNVDIYYTGQVPMSNIEQLIVFEPADVDTNIVMKEDVDKLFSLLLTKPTIYYIVFADNLSNIQVSNGETVVPIYNYLNEKVNEIYNFENRELTVFAGVNKSDMPGYTFNNNFVLTPQYTITSWNPNKTQLVSTYKELYPLKYNDMVEGPHVTQAAYAGLDKVFRDQPGCLSDSTMDQERAKIKRVYDGSMFSHGIKSLYNPDSPESGYMYTRKDLVELQNLSALALKEDKSKGTITVVRDLTFADPYKNPGLKFISVKVTSDVTRQRLRSALKQYIGKRNNSAVRSSILERGNYVLRYNRDNDRMYERLPDLLAEGFSLKFDEAKMAEYPRQLGKLFLNCKITPPFAIQDINIEVIVE